MVNSGPVHGGGTTDKHAAGLGGYQDRRRNVSALAVARWSRPDGVLPSFDRLAVAGPSAGGRGPLPHHASPGAPQLAPHPGSPLTGPRGQSAPENERGRHPHFHERRG